MTASASEIACSSAVKMLDLFGSLVVLVTLPWTTAAATLFPILEPSVYTIERNLCNGHITQLRCVRYVWLETAPNDALFRVGRRVLRRPATSVCATLRYVGWCSGPHPGFCYGDASGPALVQYGHKLDDAVWGNTSLVSGPMDLPWFGRDPPRFSWGDVGWNHELANELDKWDQRPINHLGTVFTTRKAGCERSPLILYHMLVLAWKC